MAAFLMAVVFRGLDAEELDVMVDVMLHSGRVLDLSHLPGPRIDKHSTGGVGDKVSLALAPLAAELGLYVPMMSGRGLGHTGGTLDKLEAIPGFRTDITLERFAEVLEACGCAMIGQTAEIAPLDQRLYALRNATATVPSIPLIAASIMSKKLAEGLTALVLDVKVGSGAFIPDPERSRELARTMVDIGRARGLPVTALLTAMDRPLGRAIGNALEMREAIECLSGAGPADLREVVLALAAEMLLLGGVAADRGEGEAAASRALDSGAALARFARMVELQGGDPGVAEDPGRLPAAPDVRAVEAGEEGWVKEVAPVPLGYGVVEMGGGRARMADELDPAVGFVVEVAPGDRVGPGHRLGRVHARSPEQAERGAGILRGAVVIDREVPPHVSPLVVDRIGGDSTHR